MTMLYEENKESKTNCQKPTCTKLSEKFPDNLDKNMKIVSLTRCLLKLRL